MKFVIRFIQFIILAVLLVIVACQDEFLEKPIGSDVTEDTIFSTRLKAQSFLWETYRQVLPSGLPLRWWNGSYQIPCGIRASMCDEVRSTIGWGGGFYVNSNGLNPTIGFIQDWFNKSWDGIRRCFVFTENIDRVPDIPDDEKQEMKAEAKTMIALRYQELLKRFGGVPIVDKRLSISDDFMIPRSTLAKTVDFIVNICDSTAKVLPSQYESKWRGRVHKGVALAVKARTLLFAASPLFNPPDGKTYMSFSEPELIAYPSYDASRWEAAAEANKAVIDWANQSGWCEIIDTDNPFDDYGRATSEHDNSEMLLAYKGKVTSWQAQGFKEWYLPNLDWRGGQKVTFNITKYFYTEDGEDQDWPEVEEVRSFDDYTQRMNEMEPRFKQVVQAVGQRPYNNTDKWNWSFTENPGGVEEGVGMLTKFLYNYQWEGYKDWPIFRLSEFYLNYAEAVNEASATDQRAYDALNVIRDRAGLPLITKSDPRYDTQSELREAIRRERAVELYAEEHRLFDVRRWKIANQEGIIGGPFYGFDFELNNSKDGYVSYRTQWLMNRYWMDKMYLYPFPQEEVNKGYIIQNPGY
jgi:hypothetical protein